MADQVVKLETLEMSELRVISLLPHAHLCYLNYHKTHFYLKIPQVLTFVKDPPSHHELLISLEGNDQVRSKLEQLDLFMIQQRQKILYPSPYHLEETSIAYQPLLRKMPTTLTPYMYVLIPDHDLIVYGPDNYRLFHTDGVDLIQRIPSGSQCAMLIEIKIVFNKRHYGLLCHVCQLKICVEPDQLRISVENFGQSDLDDLKEVLRLFDQRECCEIPPVHECDLEGCHDLALILCEGLHPRVGLASPLRMIDQWIIKSVVGLVTEHVFSDLLDIVEKKTESSSYGYFLDDDDDDDDDNI